MADIVSELISFHNGVSQQDVSLRLATQVEESINCLHTIENGLRRRNPTELISNATGITEESFIYNYDRGSANELSEKYSVVITSGNTIKVLDLETGLEVPVTNSSGTYLTPYSHTGYSAVTIKDTTFITNRNKVCAIKTKTESNVDLSQVAYIWIKRVDVIDGYTYNVVINGTTKTSSGQLTSLNVASDLVTKINTISGITAVSSGNIIKVTGNITSISTSDSVGDTAIGYIWKIVPTEDDLPSSMPYSATVQVGGTNASKAKYWLKVSDSRWVETKDPNINYELDNATMPHKLTRHYDVSGNPYFVFEPITWDKRVVGDETVAKSPSFIGTGIVDLFFFRNRLGFITPSNILFSEDGFYYNFFRTSQVSVLDSDRIDVTVDAKKAVRLHYVEFVQDDMIVFGDRTQFRISYNGTVTASTIYASIVSEYDMNTNVRPLSIDDRIIFIAKNGNHTAVFTYLKDNFNNLNRADNISTHISSYIDGGISKIVGSSVNNIILLISSTNKDTIYVYKYLLDNKKAVQSAWSKWIFDGNINSAFVSESKLYLLLDRFNSPTDIDYVFSNGVWNDEFNWEDDYYFQDAPSTTTSNLEKIELYPQDVSLSYLDNNIVNYTSSLVLSKYCPKVKDVARTTDNVQMKSITVNCKDGSMFDLSIINKGNNRVIDKKYATRRKLFLGGKPDDNVIAINSDSGLGFEVNGVAIEARITNRSTKI